MNLGKHTRYLRTLELKLASPPSQENTIQWILMKPVLSLQNHYKLLHLLIAIEQIHTIPFGPLDPYLDFIFYRKN